MELTYSVKTYLDKKHVVQTVRYPRENKSLEAVLTLRME